MAQKKKQTEHEFKLAEQLEARHITEAAISLHPNDPKAQVVYFFQRFRIPAARGRARSVSKLTTIKYLSTIECFINEMLSKGTKVKAISDLTARQLVSVMRSWEEQGKSSSTLANRYSVITRFLTWQQVQVPYKSVHEVLLDKEKGKRITSVTKSKSWSSNGVSFEEVHQKLCVIDEFAALQLQLAAAFGLRVQEACAIRPADSDQGQYLIVHLGAKGGRGRTVKIQTAYQRQVLDAAKEFATRTTGTGFVRKRGQTVKSAINRFYYCLKLAGVNKKELGVSAHGLRHEYANELYASQTGHDAPVNHGAKVDRQLEMDARKQVTEALGHSRIAITSAYLGSHKMMDRAAQKYLHALNLQLTNPDSELAALYWEMQGCVDNPGEELRLFLAGLAAEGKAVAGAPMMLCAGIFTQGGLRSTQTLTEDQLSVIAKSASKATCLWSVCVLDASVPETVERFELLFVNSKI